MLQCPNNNSNPEYEFASKAYNSLRVTNDLISQTTERLLKIKDKLMGESPAAVNSSPISKALCSGLIGDIINTSDENNVRLTQMLQIIMELEKI